ncbi:iron ABC transporter permease [Brachybacterium sp. MASK1Z-5]|uniref:Iron ABC transporter permease n=1 Tax=Brachybacterium halotolerans TaxID=2795215 RepID=A0ABS1BFF6_9MICO|nr:iron ABC transporter permease [Brachybacterium halotolerans]MBK0332770.1 iron ABC transporter permease [Brachybacterium halotolerans]
MRDHRARRAPWLFTLAAVLLALGVLWAGASGQFPISPAQVLDAIWRGATGTATSGDQTRLADATLWNVRFPRVVMALLVGSALAVGGALMQGVFGNPLAEPGIVGVSSGAAAAACIVIVLGLTVLGSWTLVAGAFVGGLAATAVVYSTARQGGRTEVVTLVLTGIAVNAVAGAIIALMTFLGTNATREQIVFWQLGSLNGSRWVHVAVAAPIVVVCLALTALVARPMDLLSLGEKPARHLGVDVERLRIGVIVMVAILTSAAVAFTGIIAFVGLVVPHVIRMITGPGHRILLPASALCGAVLLLYADTIARTAVAYADLPIGLLTSLIGGPFFFYLIRRTRRGAGGWS